MKRFRDLEILGPARNLRDLVSALPTNFPNNWWRDDEAEKRLAGIAGQNIEGFAFARAADAQVPATGLFLMLEEGRLWVTNIVPQETGQLSFDQYNAILEEFAVLVDPEVRRHAELRLNASSEDAAITEWVTPPAAKLLEQFSVLANMSTGSSHPSDFARWAAFIIRVHKDGSVLYPEDLRRWLVEALGWPLEKADKLALEYEFAREILDAYDQDPA